MKDRADPAAVKIKIDEGKGSARPASARSSSSSCCEQLFSCCRSRVTGASAPTHYQSLGEPLAASSTSSDSTSAADQLSPKSVVEPRGEKALQAAETLIAKVDARSTQSATASSTSPSAEILPALSIVSERAPSVRRSFFARRFAVLLLSGAVLSLALIFQTAYMLWYRNSRGPSDHTFGAKEKSLSATTSKAVGSKKQAARGSCFPQRYLPLEFDHLNIQERTTYDFLDPILRRRAQRTQQVLCSP